MLKISLVAMFIAIMTTFVIAASAMPVPETETVSVVAAVENGLIQSRPAKNPTESPPPMWPAVPMRSPVVPEA